VVLVHTQNFRLPIRKAHLGTTSDTRLFSGEKRTSHFKRVTTVFDPTRTCRFRDDVEHLDLNQGVALRIIQFKKFSGVLSDGCLSKWKNLP
jgi:hypothetical protein